MKKPGKPLENSEKLLRFSRKKFLVKTHGKRWVILEDPPEKFVRWDVIEDPGSSNMGRGLPTTLPEAFVIQLCIQIQSGLWNV